jgi:subtilisin family serine protease
MIGGWRNALPALAAALILLFALPANAPASAPDASEREIMVMVPHPPEHFRPNSSYGGSYGDELARSARERLAHRIARKHGLTLVDNYPMPLIGVDCFIMAVPAGRSIEAAVQEVSNDTSVAWSQPVTMFKAQSAQAWHNDPLYAAQPTARQWQLADLHRVSTGRGIKVAVIDSAIDIHHPDLAGQILLNRNFVAGSDFPAELHGTEVAGIIAAKADNRLGVAGVAPGARLIGLRACWQKSPSATVCDSFSLAKALYFAIEDKADVINLSLGGPDDRLLRELLTVARSHGAAVVVAYDPSQPDGGFPASMPGVIAVSNAALAGLRRSVYTAPGRDVPTTLPGGRWYLVSGSSFAAAHVSGLVALIRGRDASAHPTLVSRGPGSGTIDACATVARLFADCNCSCSLARTASKR